MRKLLKAHDRMVKASCELGLHLKLCDPSRNPFAVLLNVEQSRLMTEVHPFNTEKEKVLVPASLLATMLSKHKSLGTSIKKLISGSQLGVVGDQSSIKAQVTFLRSLQNME